MRPKKIKGKFVCRGRGRMERKIEKRKRGCWNVTVGISTTASEKYDFELKTYNM